MRKLPLILIVMLLLAGCMSEDDASKIVVSSTFSSDTARSRDKVRIDIDASSLDSRLSRMRISSFDTELGEVILKDSLLDTKEFHYSYLYVAPMLETDTVRQELSILVEDKDGNSSTYRKRIVVLKKDYLLKELSGITMWQQGGNSKPDGYSLSLLRPVMTATADSADIDIFATNDMGKFSRQWETNTDVYFVRANSFDYPRATAYSVAAAYSASVGYHSVAGITDGDIIILGRGAKAEGVIQVVFAIDEGDESRYYFNLKPIG